MDKHVLFHSKAESARLIGVSERTLHTLIAKKQLAVRRIGRRVLISDAELLKFAQRKTQYKKYFGHNGKGLPEKAALGHEQKSGAASWS